MTRAPILCVSLLCLSSGVPAQDAPDLFSLTFTPGPVLDDVLLAAPDSASPDSDEIPARFDRTREVVDRDRLLDSAEQIAESISAEESLNSGRSSNLIGELTSLAAVYQDLGEHLLAIAALERARQISRINDGLYSLEQAAILEQMIDTMETAGLLGESSSLQISLIELALRNEGDPRVPSILTSVAGRQMDAVNEYLEERTWLGTREPLPAPRGSGWEPSTPKVGRHLAPAKLNEIRNTYDAAIEEALANDDHESEDSLGLEAELGETYYLIDTVNEFVEEGYLPRPGSRAWEPEPPTNDREFALLALRRARRLHSAAVQAARRNGSHETAEYLGLQEQLVETYYFELAHPELHPPRMRYPERMNYLSGASVLDAKVIDRLTQGASAVDIAMALVELGDWHLLFSFNGTALEKYQDAYDLLVEEEVPVETVARLFSPPVPAILPAFASDSMAFDPARRYRGHIDVSIEIGRYGESRRVDILDASSGASNAIERRLKTHIAESRFRPRFVDGRVARSDQFALRYYFDH